MSSNQLDMVPLLQLTHFFSDDLLFESARVVSDFQLVRLRFHVEVLMLMEQVRARVMFLLPGGVQQVNMHRHTLQRERRILRHEHDDLKRGWTRGYSTNEIK